MTHTRFKLIVLMLAVVAGPAMAQTSAHLAPASAALYIELPALAALRAELEQDAVAQLLKQQLPARRQPAAWLAVQQMMGLSGEEIFDRYFGKRVLIIGQRTGPNAPAVVLSRVDQADMDLATERLMWQHTGEQHGFDLYETADGKGLFASDGKWLAIASAQHGDWLEQVIAGIDAPGSLAEDAEFQTWVGKLPDAEGPRGLLFVRDPAARGIHALSARWSAGDVVIDYAGRGPEWLKAREAMPADAGPLTFGPVPQSAAAALSVNVHQPTLDPKATAGLDRLLEGRSFQDAIWSRLNAPIVLSLGQVPGDAATGLKRVPTITLAVPMKDRAVAAEIDRMIGNALLVFNVATTEWQTKPVVVEQHKHAGVVFHAADLGQPLAEHRDLPQFADVLNLSYGPIGDWYVVTSQPATMRAWIEAAQQNRSPREPASIGGAGVDRGIVGLWLQGRPLAELVEEALETVLRERPALARAMKEGRASRVVRGLQGLDLLADVLEHYQAAGMYLKAADDEAVIGRLQFQQAN